MIGGLPSKPSPRWGSSAVALTSGVLIKRGPPTIPPPNEGVVRLVLDRGLLWSAREAAADHGGRPPDDVSDRLGELKAPQLNKCVAQRPCRQHLGGLLGWEGARPMRRTSCRKKGMTASTLTQRYDNGHIERTSYVLVASLSPQEVSLHNHPPDVV